MSLIRKIAKIGVASLLPLSANAIICLPDEPKDKNDVQFSAVNCSYFSGSKALKYSRNGAIFNFDQQGDYDDKLMGNSYVYCPVVGDVNASEIAAAQVSVFDKNQQTDVVCQTGQAQYTSKGFSAFWGATVKSTDTGKQTLSAVAPQLNSYGGPISTFISCSLPPQDENNLDASSLMAYRVLVD